MKPFLAALAVSISFAGGGGHGDPQLGAVEARTHGGEYHISAGQYDSNTRIKLIADSTSARQQPARAERLQGSEKSESAYSETEFPGDQDQGRSSHSLKDRLAMSPNRETVGSPAKTHWLLIGKVQTASLVALALADYDSTQRGLARGGREVGLVLSCGGQLCQGRYAAINAGVVLGTYAITRYAIPRLPKRWRRATNIMLSGMITGRGFIVVQNYRKAARIK